MREFLKYKLEHLHLITGHRQYFKLSEAVDADGNPDGERQIRVLIDGMVMAAAQFQMIPEDAQQRIIEAAMIADQEFTELSPRLIYKWLNAQKDRFVKAGEAFEETKRIEHTAEESARIDALIAGWKMQMAGSTQEIFKGIEQDMKQIQQEDKERQERPKGSGYKRPTAEEMRQYELHNLWIRHNFDKYTAKPLPEWKPEKEWITEYLASQPTPAESAPIEEKK